MPRVAHFSSDFLPASQAFVYREVTGHVRWEVEAFAQRRQNPDRFPFEPVHTLGPGRGLPGLLERAAYLAALRSPTFAARFRRNPFDLIHAQFGPAGVQALAFAERFDLPLVCTFGGVDVAALEPRMRGRPDYLLYRLRAPRLLRHADRLLAVSRDLADRLVRLGAPPDRVHVFHRGVEVPAVQPPRPRPGPGGPVVLMVGRLVEKKGFRDGLAAAALLHREGLPLQVRIVGGGPLEQDLLARARDGGLLGPRTFAGSLTQEEVFREMERAHVLLAPSVT
ncbi:MAG: glycosyltransferase, partial [Deltaproteobacteria bacterium]|nr:glycosyltransferase [Deltaproteobacteria bacterium]